jgi:CelD/BcsL family acetyltransferase involved in cellulose biosynthesis
VATPGDDHRHELTATVLRQAEEIDSLGACWDVLATQSPASTPWQRWDFMSSWLRYASARPAAAAPSWRVILVADRGRPCLLVPLQLSGKQAGIRWLEPIGMPDNIHRPRLGLGPLDRNAYAAAADAIDTLWNEAQGLRIDEKTPDDAELRVLRELAAARGWRYRSVPLHLCPTLSLPLSWNGYWNCRSPKLRKNLNSSRRRLEAHGPLRMERFDTQGEVERGFEILLTVSSRSWKAQERIGLGISDEYRAFYREFVARMASRGRARVYCLFAGSQPIAATLALLDDDTYYSTQIAHDSRFDQFSPGTLLEAMELQSLVEEGRFKTFDFLGAALANKRRWTDTMEATERVMWLGPSVRATLFDIAYFRLKPLLRSVGKIISG